MKSLKAKFKKTDVSAIPRDMGICPGMSTGTRGACPETIQVSQGHTDLPWDVHGDMGTCWGLSQISQGHGDLPQDVPSVTGTW